MYYITGTQALNLPCSLDTCGDWHGEGISWKKANIKNSKDSVFKDYGIEKGIEITYLGNKKFNVANHIRACLDLLADSKFDLAQGMRKDFICTDKYDSEIFDKVLLLENSKNWDSINSFMEREYMTKWIRFLKNGK